MSSIHATYDIAQAAYSEVARSRAFAAPLTEAGYVRLRIPATELRYGDVIPPGFGPGVTMFDWNGARIEVRYAHLGIGSEVLITTAPRPDGMLGQARIPAIWDHKIGEHVVRTVDVYRLADEDES